MQIISEHLHPRPALRRAVRRLIALGFIGWGVLAAAQVTLLAATWPFGVLFIVTLLFSGVLLLPLLIQSALYPEVRLAAEGLYIFPMLWGERDGQFVPREAVSGVILNPLVRDNPIIGRLMFGKNYRPREGVVVLLRAGTLPGLRWRLVGFIIGGGAGRGPAFGLSSTAHTGYGALVAVIQGWADAKGTQPT